MFLSDKLNAQMFKTFVDKTLIVNNEFHVDFETIWKEVYHKMLDFDEVQMSSILNEQSRVNDKFVYVIQFFMQELINQTKTLDDQSSIQMETFAKELVNDELIRMKLVAFVMREVFEHLISSDNYQLITELTKVDTQETKNRTLLEVTLSALSKGFNVAEIHEILINLWKSTNHQVYDQTHTTPQTRTTEERTNFKEWMIVLQQFVMKELVRDVNFQEQFKIAISWAFSEELKLINHELIKLTSELTRDETLLWKDQNKSLTSVHQKDLSKVVSKLSDDFGYLLTRLFNESLITQTKNRTTVGTLRNEETETTDDVKLSLNSEFNEWIKNVFNDEVAIYATRTYKTSNPVNEEILTQVNRWLTENSLTNWSHELLVSLEQKFKEVLLNENSEISKIYLTSLMKDLVNLIEETKLEVGLTVTEETQDTNERFFVNLETKLNEFLLSKSSEDYKIYLMSLMKDLVNLVEETKLEVSLTVTEETQDRTDSNRITLNTEVIEEFEEKLKERIKLYFNREKKEDLETREKKELEVVLSRTEETEDRTNGEKFFLSLKRTIDEWIKESLKEEFEVNLISLLKESELIKENSKVRMDLREREEREDEEVDEVMITSVRNQTNRVNSDVDVPMIEFTQNTKDDAINRDDDYSVEIT